LYFRKTKLKSYITLGEPSTRLIERFVNFFKAKIKKHENPIKNTLPYVRY